MNEDSTPTVQQPSQDVQPPRRRMSPGGVRLLGYGLGLVLAAGLVAFALWFASIHRDDNAAPSAGDNALVPTPAALERPIVSEADLADRSGVRITQVALTGGGGLIDLRFMVVDPGKAGAIHDEATPPTIVDETTGVVVNQLLMGHSHTDAFDPGVTYYLVFENPGDLVQRGSTVSVLLGNAEVEHVTVR